MSLPVVNYIAENRFGYGPKAGQPVTANPGEYLSAQLKKSAVNPVLNTTGDSVSAAVKIRRLQKQAKESGNIFDDNADEIKDLKKQIAENYINEVSVRVNLIRDTDTPFLERLSWFWSNHFTVSANGKGLIISFLGAYDREAIRPHITGYFFDMLKAVVMHPAMLAYLDNDKSINPNLAALRKNPKLAGKGLNENLARELMELHTLGVSGGYTQTDVTNLAHVLTGWTLQKPEENNDKIGFKFQDKTHDETPQKILNKIYSQKGMDQGLAVLNDLAHHPSTARFICTKLARHFISDDPPQVAVQRMVQAFTSSNGYLPSVYKALIESPEVWQKPFPKAKSHMDFLTSSLRMYPDVEIEPRKIVAILTQMGQRPWNATSPQGWVDNSGTWLTADSLWKRIEWAGIVSARTSRKNDAREMAETTFGPLLSDSSRQSIARAESGPQAISLLLLSPEFQRR